MTRRVLSWFLVGWVGLVCPSLCAGVVVSTKSTPPQKCCCCPADSDRDSPATPSEPCKDSCFCSGHAVQLSKADSLPEIELSVLVGHFTTPASLVELRAGTLFIDSLWASHPPNQDKILPLLI